MDLDELASSIEIKADEEEFEDDDEESVEADLSNALSLLDDCWLVMEAVMEKKNSRQQRLTYYQFSEVERLCQEVAAFLNQFDINADNGHDKCDNYKDVDWKGDM